MIPHSTKNINIYINVKIIMVLTLRALREQKLPPMIKQKYRSCKWCLNKRICISFHLAWTLFWGWASLFIRSLLIGYYLQEFNFWLGSDHLLVLNLSATLWKHSWLGLVLLRTFLSVLWKHSWSAPKAQTGFSI